MSNKPFYAVSFEDDDKEVADFNTEQEGLDYIDVCVPLIDLFAGTISQRQFIYEGYFANDVTHDLEPPERKLLP